VGPAAPGVGGDQVLVGKGALRVVVSPAVPSVARYRVEIPPVLLYVLAVVTLRPGQPERPLLEDGGAPVPQREPPGKPLLDIAEAGQAVFSPPVRPGPGMIVREVVPGIPVRAVV